MPAVTKNRAIELFWRVHPVIYRPSGGRLLGCLDDVPVLLLVTPVVVFEPVRRA